MIYPVCVRLPAEPSVATALWAVLETGATALAAFKVSFPNRSPQRQHLEILLQLLRSKLTGSERQASCLWVERREVGDLLMVLDEGLRILSRQPFSQEMGACSSQEAVCAFLREIRKQLPPPRKPISRQSAVRKPVLAMAASASGA